MNLAEQLEPGDCSDQNSLAKATMDDLVEEIKRRCTAVVLIGVVDDEDGDETSFIKTSGSRMLVLGACEAVRWHYLDLDRRLRTD